MDSTPHADAQLSRTKVLVVDDERAIAQMVGTYLTRAGYEVSVAHTGPAAVSTARAESPEVLVLDLGLPGKRRRRRKSGSCANSKTDAAPTPCRNEHEGPGGLSQNWHTEKRWCILAAQGLMGAIPATSTTVSHTVRVVATSTPRIHSAARDLGVDVVWIRRGPPTS